MNKAIRSYTKPVYIIAFFILVAILSSVCSGWGMTGIMIAVLGSAVAIAGGTMAIKGIAHQTQQMLNGKANRMNYLMTTGPRPKKHIEYKNVYAVAEKKSQYSVTEVEDNKKTHLLEVPSKAVAVRPVQDLHKKNRLINACLELAPNFNPYHNAIIGRSITAFGMRGAGKSNTMAVLLEQLCKLGDAGGIIPGPVFDYEEDYASIADLFDHAVVGGAPDWTGKWKYKDNYWNITPAMAEAVGYEILEKGVLLILELQSYGPMEEMAAVMISIIDGMFAWADERDPKKRVPALVFLDEAEQFLPQNASTPEISKETKAKLLRAFSRVNAIGRKRGFTPIIATQRPAKIDKNVVSGSEIYFLMYQSFPSDLAYYDDIMGKGSSDRYGVASFKKGEAVVFEGGEGFNVKFDERQSEHRNNTPGLENSVKQYGGKQAGRKPQFVSQAAYEEEVDDEYEENLYEDAYENDNQEVVERVLRPVETQRSAVAQAPVIRRQKTEKQLVVEYFTENPYASLMEAQTALKATVGGKDKINKLKQEAKEDGLL